MPLTPPPLPPPDPGLSIPSLVLAIFGGVTSIGTLIVWIIKSLGSRVVQREDEDKKALTTKVEAIITGFAEMRADAKGLNATMERLSGELSATRTALDQRIEKSGQYQQAETQKLREELKKDMSDLEFRLRQDFSRALADRAKRGRA